MSKATTTCAVTRRARWCRWRRGSRVGAARRLGRSSQMLRASRMRFWRRGGGLAVGFGSKRRGCGGVFIEGACLGEGLGFGRSSDWTAAEHAVFMSVSTETTSNRWARPVSVLNAAAAYRFGPGRLMGRAGLQAWAVMVPGGLFSIFFCKSIFFLYFEIDLICF
jgi:hypothetical protein